MRRMMLLVGASLFVAFVLSGAAGSAGGSAGSVQARWVIRDLGALQGSGGTYSIAKAINERGLIVGEPFFVWQNGYMVPLGPLPNPSDAVATDAVAVAVNDRGEVAGNDRTLPLGERGGASVSPAAGREDATARHAARLV